MRLSNRNTTYSYLELENRDNIQQYQQGAGYEETETGYKSYNDMHIRYCEKDAIYNKNVGVFN